VALLGWSEGANLAIDVRWGENDPERDRRYAAELVGLGPDVILGLGTLATAALHHATSTLPIVFAFVSDPVGSGLVDSLARSRRQHYRVHDDRVRLERKMAGARQSPDVLCLALS
jgi:ABC-type uncharacterized transport system substrate-binding protein